ncbi:sodium ion-translocating decarboxylase subunit beta [Agathobaculum sp. NSJ-28]|uniref:Sodium ion-translocating decarboxylase subunit beta n=2 Tax=Agathobaculum TaxID=2048137 RepID=A0A923LXE5_9FIRM|nr:MULTISPECIES: sodium ion-translocating decarboxylase subunit beta [Butyricicoccaceae]MBC5726171.1 sodium ion-translocating decarboxylase subunit beta [Agathobaculum faecis]MCU6790266.1 sodium ion-translocating decarboxylase subunit beta [Agathobaculum ammoniilyticum]WOC76137.1 sodium ion-translocating decarboxylase subunit beta [Intestinibacillus sp. NTUH-41-i26]SCJ56359.1 Glutaconyl-CoA decarboxylase subunit beta [uncultured Butyricicoccus sp.]
MQFSFIGALEEILAGSGFAALFSDPRSLVMILIAFVLLFLGIGKKFEPLLLVPIAFGILLANFPLTGLLNAPANGASPGMLWVFYQGVEHAIYPSLIFLGIGAMTDFGPLIARPSSLLLGAAAQLGIFAAFLMALALGFAPNVAASIGIIGGADGPTAILVTSRLAADYLPAIAIAAYSYMALIPLIQPPLMRALTTKKEREIKMEQLRPVSKTEKIVFPIAVATVVILLIPDTAPLIGMLMLGNLFRECGVTDRLSDTAQNTLCNIVTIFLGLSVGCKAVAEKFLTMETIKIIVLGLIAFMFSTIGGLLFGKIMCKLSGGKVNPLIGSAGVSAVPMAARVSQVEGQKANPANFLLMHAMGPNVAGVIGSAVAAGFLLKVFGA